METIDEQLKWDDDFLGVLLLVLMGTIFSDWNAPDLQKNGGIVNDPQ